jgi:crotonobetaine/carnitine-CoA ligase
MKTPLEVLRLYPEHDYTLHGAFQSRAARDPQRPFVVHGDVTWTWQSFDGQVSRIAALLAERGIVKGDRVAVMGRNSDGHVLCLLAIARIGAIMVPVNPEFGVEETRYVLHHATLDGGTVRKGPSVESTPFVHDYRMGFSVRRDSLRVS